MTSLLRYVLTSLDNTQGLTDNASPKGGHNNGRNQGYSGGHNWSKTLRGQCRCCLTCIEIDICEVKTIRPSYLHNGNFDAGKAVSFY